MVKAAIFIEKIDIDKNMEEKILTKHPKDKKGFNIGKDKYDVIKKSIIKCLNKNNLSYAELTKCVKLQIKKFDGSINWYVEFVNLI